MTGKRAAGGVYLIANAKGQIQWLHTMLCECQLQADGVSNPDARACDASIDAPYLALSRLDDPRSRSTSQGYDQESISGRGQITRLEESHLAARADGDWAQNSNTSPQEHTVPCGQVTATCSSEVVLVAEDDTTCMNAAGQR